MKSLKIFMLFVQFLFGFTMNAQKEGNTWVIGYYSYGDPRFSIMYIDFSPSKPHIEYHYNEKLSIIETAANICDANGTALIWTNGMEIFGSGGKRIADTISYDPDPLSYWNYWSPGGNPLGFPMMDAAIILPIPQSDNEYSVIYHFAEPHPTLGYLVSKYLEARVRVNSDSSFTLLSKDQVVIPHHLWYTARVNACRHANGRDWWIIVSEADSPIYYAYILGPNGIHFDHEGDVGMILKYGLGQATFSLNGNYMARMDATTFEEGQYITLFSFDRCSGDLILIDQFLATAGYFTGVAFSPSERYLYADDNTHLWQWDLMADDIASSQILVDTFDGFIEPGGFGTRFGPMALAPDGRIYIAPSSGGSKRFHVIDRPDLPSPDCRFLQRNIFLDKWNARSMPNIPNFRLGPIDGSPCDTLGINNLPVARWRWEPDQPGYLEYIRFTDLSFYDPHEWHWDFDDGSTSDTPSPLHTFEPGLYHVCLTVSNDFGTDSTCQWIEIFPTGIQEVENKNTPDISILPNPFTDQLIIESKSGTFRSAQIQLYDIRGRNVFNQELVIPSKIFLPDFPPGMYLCHIQEQDGSAINFKLMKE